MVFTELIAVVHSVPQLMERNDDDFIDRLSHRYTTALLLIFAVIVTTKQYVGDPITCWVPKHFTSSWEKYTNSYCWVKNTYYLPFEEHIPKEDEDAKRHVIPYYQWVPLILAAQALAFYLPVVIWRSLNNKTGMEVNDIVETAEKIQLSDEPETRDKSLMFLTKQMDRYLGLSRKNLPQVGFTLSIQKLISYLFCCCGKRFGNYLVFLYLFTKCMYLINVFGQLFLLNEFLNTKFHMYGIDVIASLIRGEDWTQSDRFPRVTMCDFKVRRIGNIQRYTVQCVLPINLFNEKIYLFIWYWMVIVAGFTIYGLIMWILRLSFKVDRYRYVKKHIKIFGKYNPDNPQERSTLHSFVEKYLRQDGVFVFRLVDHNTNSVTLSEIVCSVWQYYKNNLTPSTTPDTDDTLPLIPGGTPEKPPIDSLD